MGNIEEKFERDLKVVGKILKTFTAAIGIGFCVVGIGYIHSSSLKEINILEQQVKKGYCSQSIEKALEDLKSREELNKFGRIIGTIYLLGSIPFFTIYGSYRRKEKKLSSS